MTDNRLDSHEEAPESAVQPLEEVPEGSGDTPDTNDQDDAGTGGKEAAKYRRRLREVEAERDGLTGRLTAFQRGMAEQMAENLGLKPKALWASADLADLLADDGAVDGVRVYDAAQKAIAELGISRPKGTSRKPRENLQAGTNPESSGPGWAELLRGAK
jgi:hypothetical protein